MTSSRRRQNRAGLAGTRRLYGRVEREQIGLPGDRGDQFDDVADAGGRLRQFGDARVGLARLVDRLAGDLADSCTWRLISLTEEVSSSVADATDCTLVEASSDAAATFAAVLRALCGPGQRGGGGFEFGRGRRHGLDDLADGAFELVGELDISALRCLAAS